MVRCEIIELGVSARFRVGISGKTFMPFMRVYRLVRGSQGSIMCRHDLSFYGANFSGCKGTSILDYVGTIYLNKTKV